MFDLFDLFDIYYLYLISMILLYPSISSILLSYYLYSIIIYSFTIYYISITFIILYNSNYYALHFINSFFNDYTFDDKKLIYSFAYYTQLSIKHNKSYTSLKPNCYIDLPIPIFSKFILLLLLTLLLLLILLPDLPFDFTDLFDFCDFDPEKLTLCCLSFN